MDTIMTSLLQNSLTKAQAKPRRIKETRIHKPNGNAIQQLNITVARTCALRASESAPRAQLLSLHSRTRGLSLVPPKSIVKILNGTYHQAKDSK
ncbi:hypothetical protein GBA52_003824 [Prunus armeniaca]|nr:hypothetical protein GBA52_003824 [Prunus armeniaca]